MPLPHDPGPHWGEVGIHGLHRPREWDAVTLVDAPGLAGDEAWFVVLEDGGVVAEPRDFDARRLRPGVSVAPPFRVHAIRRDGSSWALATTRIETLELADDPGGTTVELAWDGNERSVRIDGSPTLAAVPELERHGAARSPEYVVRAARLLGDVWEVSVEPL